MKLNEKTNRLTCDFLFHLQNNSSSQVTTKLTNKIRSVVGHFTQSH